MLDVEQHPHRSLTSLLAAQGHFEALQYTVGVDLEQNRGAPCRLPAADESLDRLLADLALETAKPYDALLKESPAPQGFVPNIVLQECQG